MGEQHRVAPMALAELALLACSWPASEHRAADNVGRWDTEADVVTVALDWGEVAADKNPVVLVEGFA
jgi:hypothetical protein